MAIDIVRTPVSLHSIGRMAASQFGDFVKAVVDVERREARRPVTEPTYQHSDPRWRERLREIARARELLCDAAAGGGEYGSSLEALDRYFLAFAVAARVQRSSGPDPGRASGV